MRRLMFFGAVGAVGAYFLLNSNETFTALSFLALVPIVWVAVRTKSVGWWLIAAGQLAFATGDLIAYEYEFLFEGTLSFPDLSDVFYLLVYPLILAGLLCLGREKHSLKAAMMFGAIGMLAYASTVFQYITNIQVGSTWLAIAYPLLDIILLSVVAGILIIHEGEWTWWYLAVAFSVLLFTDSLYAYEQVAGSTYFTGGYLDFGWLVYYGLLAGAAAVTLQEDSDARSQVR